MPYDINKINSFIERVRDSKHNTFHAICSQLFGYLEKEFSANSLYVNYSNRIPEWLEWAEKNEGGHSGHIWIPPKNEADHKSLAFALYKLCAMEKYGPMKLYHANRFDENVYLFNNDFLPYLMDSINEIIHEDDRVSQNTVEDKTEPLKMNNKNIFIVHGRNELIKLKAARFIEKIGLNPIILHEQANQGTEPISQKLARYSNQIAAALVLLTSDDEGRLKDSNGDSSLPLNPRARQNVVFEMGYFMGFLGSNRVFGLMSGGVERPSDYDGIYINMDGEDWQVELARDLKAAGIEVDANALFS